MAPQGPKPQIATYICGGLPLIRISHSIHGLHAFHRNHDYWQMEITAEPAAHIGERWGFRLRRGGPDLDQAPQRTRKSNGRYGIGRHAETAKILATCDKSTFCHMWPAVKVAAPAPRPATGALNGGGAERNRKQRAVPYQAGGRAKSLRGAHIQVENKTETRPATRARTPGRVRGFGRSLD
jgi:hypothetical protein